MSSSVKFSIVTPCFNAERYIGETIDTILSQTALKKGRVTLEYIIVDGRSTDNTLSVIEERLKSHPLSDMVQVISEPDQGMYDALAKGLQRATGDICAYLNAGDLYSLHAFDIVLEVMQGYPIDWLTGMRVGYNEAGQLTRCQLPFPYRRRLLTSGLYNGSLLHYVQQESTFWRRNLLEYVNYVELAQFKYAGDYYLWHQFAPHKDLKIVEAHIGGFRLHRGQLSENISAYNAELRAIRRMPSLFDYTTMLFDKVMTYAPIRLWRLFYPAASLSFNDSLQTWKYS